MLAEAKPASCLPQFIGTLMLAAENDHAKKRGLAGAQGLHRHRS
jgi:hypothetical protein